MFKWNESATLESLLRKHLPEPHTGKVRDSYQLDVRYHGRPTRLAYVSNRASIFDIRLGFEVPGKGEALNAFNIAARLLLRSMIPYMQDDLIAYGPMIDSFLPSPLRNISELWRRATVVEELTMIDIECVVRGYLTGSGYKSYARGEKVCGHDVTPKGQPEGFKLRHWPIFTPTTKSEGGHDEPLDYMEVRRDFGSALLETCSTRVYECLAAHAEKGGVIGADTKFEWGHRQGETFRDGLILADEVWTPDSSRFWSAAAYAEHFPDRLPPSMDKQILREWGKSVGIDKLDPKNDAGRQIGRAKTAPPEVLEGMRSQVERAFAMMYGQSLAQFQQTSMLIV